MSLESELRDALSRGAPTTMEGMARQFGRTRAEQNKAIAAELGVTVRTVQRWRTTATERRRPRAMRVRQLQGATQERVAEARAKQIRRRGLTVRNFVGRVRVSRDTRRRDVTDVEISPELLDDMADAVEAGDWETAAAHFDEAFALSYGIAGEVNIETVDVLRFE